MQKVIAISTCFLQKINILSNKPSKTIQKFRCTLTNLNTADEVTRIDGTVIWVRTVRSHLILNFFVKKVAADLELVDRSRKIIPDPDPTITKL
jgi:hypothetical protein